MLQLRFKGVIGTEHDVTPATTPDLYYFSSPKLMSVEK